MSNIEPDYPAYARSERVADAAMHVLGVSGALTGAVWMMIWAFGHVSGVQTFALSVYGLTLIATFIASAVYHFTPWENLRPTFRRIDHAAIYLKIAGTYTPLVFMIGSLSSYLVLATVWALAAFGMIRKFWFWKKPGRNGVALYLVMGWLSVLLVGSLFSVLPLSALILIAAGGSLYSIGVIFHILEKMKFANAIWHGFVLTASVCFFVAIALGINSSVI